LSSFEVRKLRAPRPIIQGLKPPITFALVAN
jgi:hypothetical protein